MRFPFLTLRNLTVRHLDKPIFEDLNFEIKKGEQWALVGESGSGKTALLQTIVGKLNVVKGEIQPHFYTQWLDSQPEADPFITYRNLIAEVAQKHRFKNLSNTSDFYYQQRYHATDVLDAPTVENYLHSLPAPLLPTDFWTYDRVVQTFRLEPLLDKQLLKLSNGETKRLLLASALWQQPQLLLLDQPLTGLDVQTRSSFNHLLQEIIDSGITILMATSATEIPDAITHVAVLEQGKIIHTCLREEFVPRDEKEKSAALDQEELQSLLSLQTMEQFETIVELKDILIKYGAKQVLEQVNWRIGQGERWALLGPNGAGKTTLLSLINGDNPQSYANHIVLFDMKRGSGETIWDIKKRIGFVSPELFQFFPLHNTCLQVVESGFYDTLGLKRPSEPKNAEVARRWMALLGIAEDASKPFRHATASTQRLCLLARALLKNPPLLILDEPCQGLDHRQQEQFKQVLDGICAQSNTTLIYVTHYQDELPESVTQELRLEQGKVVASA